MSLTIIAFGITAVALVLSITAFSISSGDLKTVTNAIGGVLFAVAAFAAIIGAGSYNSNSGETARQLEVECLEEQGQVVRVNETTTVCMTEDSKIIRKF